jgi:predicted transcriptional regulator
MNNLINSVVCPCCGGTGKISIIKKVKSKKENIKKNIVLTLRESGYSIRKIAKMLELKSSSSVFYYIKKARK